MKCPFCTSLGSQVLESRVVENDQAIRRRRECPKCERRFTTYERVKNNFLWVVKKDGRREPFDREKIKRGISRAVEKRPVTLEQVNKLVDQVEREALRKKREEISTKVLGRAVLRRLRKIDKVAWLRFASVYLEFAGLEDFEEVIDQISQRRKGRKKKT